MARVAGVNIPDKKQAWISLTHIFGIGEQLLLRFVKQQELSLIQKFPH